MVRQIALPGQIQFTVHRLATGIVFMHPLRRHLLVNFRQAYTHDGVKGFLMQLMLLQEGFHLWNLCRGHIQQEIVRAVWR